jgi:hypothetical protein
MADANLAQKKQAVALGGLQGMYGTELSGGENALGLSNSALEGADKSGGMNNPWNQYGLQYMKDVGSVTAAMAGGG